MVLRQEQGETPGLLEYFAAFQASLREPLQRISFRCCTVCKAPLPPWPASKHTSEPLKVVDEALSRETEDNALRMPGYEIVAELGRGGMGVVYQARQCSLKRQVALKMILAGLDADPSARARFRTEAEAVARLQHPNIVQIYEVGEHEGRPFLSLEFVEGGSLRQKIAQAQPFTREAAQLVETLARAVHHTHKRGILHRDLNPNNVLLMADGTPKISDFGLAKLMDSGPGMTRTEAFLGTPNYMAPEQAAGHIKQVGPAADVYSLGAILYELLTGHPPFEARSVLETLDQVRNREPVAPRRRCVALATDLETICLKCLEKAPQQRYSSAEALADDLRRFLDRATNSGAAPVPRWRQLARSARRHPLIVAGILGTVLLLCLLLTSRSYLRAKEQLASHRAEDNYQQFVRRRNDAHFYGLLAGEQGARFLGNEAGDNWRAAESAIRDALARGGVDLQSNAIVDPDVPAARKAAVTEDCYALLLVLAGLREQQAVAQPEHKQRCQEALRLLDRASQLGYQTRAYHLRRAYLLEQLGERDEAQQEKARAAALPLQGALDHFLLGEEQFRRGDWGRGRDFHFARTVSLQPGHFWAQFFLAVCHLQTRNWEAAKAGLNACLNLHPDFVWAYLFRSFANERLQAWSEAEADFQHALRLDPNDDARYVLFLTRGILHFNQGALEQAADDFRSALALKPVQYNAHLNLAQLHLVQGQFEQAEEEMNQALRLGPPVAVVFAYHLERGRHLLRKQKYEDALKAGDAALKLCPNRAESHEVRARALLALDRYAQAEASFDDFLQKGGTAGTDVYRGRGQARMKLGRYPEAAEDYSRGNLAPAPDGDLYQHRGWALFFAEAWKLALRDFSKAIELESDPERCLHGPRGLARVMLGQYREAVEDADARTLLQPSSPEMMHNLACIFAQAVSRVSDDREELNRQALANTYGERALDAVQKTLQMLRQEERPAFWRGEDPTPMRPWADSQRRRGSSVWNRNMGGSETEEGVFNDLSLFCDFSEKNELGFRKPVHDPTIGGVSERGPRMQKVR